MLYVCLIGLFTSASILVEEFTRFIPFFGSMIAAPISFGGTYCMLNHVLDRLHKVAEEVLTYVDDDE